MLGPLGRLVGVPRALLEASWGHSGPLEDLLGFPGELLGGIFGASWMLLECLWVPLAALLECSGEL